MTLSANTLLFTYFHVVSSCLEGFFLTFILLLTLLIIDLIMTSLSKRRHILTKMVFNILNFSILSQFFVFKISKKQLQITIYDEETRGNSLLNAFQLQNFDCCVSLRALSPNYSVE